MKVLKKIGLCLALLFPTSVFAASASISVPSSVEVGSTVTAKVTLSQTAAWNISINSSGNTSGCSQKFADTTSNGGNTNKVLTVTCKATSIGAIGFVVTGDITSANGSSSNVSLSKRVTVTEVKPKSTDNNLKSISIDGYELTPEFNKDTLEYSVTVPSNINKVKLDASKSDSKASIEGIGEFEVSEGNNPLNIVVTSESGSQKTYVVNVNVEDINPIKITINNKEYTIVKNNKNLEGPSLYEATTIKIGDEEVPAFYNEKANLTLVGIKDSDGNISYAIYDEKTNSYTKYHEYTSNLTLYITKFEGEIKGYKKDSIDIDGEKVEVYRYKDNSRFVVVYAMNLENGKYDYYSYDTNNKTFQVFNREEIEDLNKLKDNYFYAMCVFGGGLVLAIIIVLCLIKKKTRKIKTNKKGSVKNHNIELLEDVIDSDEKISKARKEIHKKDTKKKK